MKVNSFKRLGTGLIAASLLALAVSVPAAAAPPGGTSRNVTVTGTGPIFDGAISVSAGEEVSFQIKVANAGPQTVNNVSLVFGLDDDPDPQANGDATPPTDFGTGITVSSSTAGCSDGAFLSCSIGTIGARKSFTANVTLVSAGSSTTATGDMMVEAVASVAEAGGDSGYNIDTFTDQGAITILAFSCEAVTAYRGGPNKTVSTCAVTDTRNANGQSASVTLPGTTTTMVLSENGSAACPVVSNLTCIGDEVDADITGDTLDDTVTWTIQIQLNGAKVTLSKLVVVHTDDSLVSTTISLAKSNACKGSNVTNCGSASISGDVLTITVKTPGNGKTRLLG